MNASELIEKFYKLPLGISDDNYLVVTVEQIKEIFNEKRIKIIELLYKQNNLTERKISDLLEFDVHKDLIFLKHLKLIDIKDGFVNINIKMRIAIIDLSSRTTSKLLDKL